jgi:hypothetical protein
VIYEDNIYTKPNNPVNIGRDSEQSKQGGHNWEKYVIGLFHVSEYLGHFKAIQKCRKNMEIVWSGGTPDQTISLVL